MSNSEDVFMKPDTHGDVFAGFALDALSVANEVMRIAEPFGFEGARYSRHGVAFVRTTEKLSGEATQKLDALRRIDVVSVFVLEQCDTGRYAVIPSDKAELMDCEAKRLEEKFAVGALPFAQPYVNSPSHILLDDIHEEWAKRNATGVISVLPAKDTILSGLRDVIGEVSDAELALFGLLRASSLRTLPEGQRSFVVIRDDNLTVDLMDHIAREMTGSLEGTRTPITVFPLPMDGDVSVLSSVQMLALLREVVNDLTEEQLAEANLKRIPDFLDITRSVS